MRDWKSCVFFQPIHKRPYLKPTYEGLKVRVRQLLKDLHLNLKPTYEGLKDDYSSQDVTDIEPI